MEDQYRQGDVFLEKIEKLPADLKVKDNILLRGETTGHAHRIEGAVVYTDKNGMQYVQIQKEAQIFHEEHDVVTVPQGLYQMLPQREYHPTANRLVMD